MNKITGDKILTYFIFPINPLRRLLHSIRIRGMIGGLLPTIHAFATFMYLLTMLLYSNGGAGRAGIVGIIGTLLALLMYQFLGLYILIFIIVGYMLGYLQIMIDFFRGKILSELRNNFDL